MPQHLFVYGTLHPDRAPAEIAHAVRHLREIGPATLRGTRYDLGDYPGVVIYPIYCLINHACYNNTNYVKFPDLHLELRSQLAIRKGEQIFTRYVSSTIGEK